MASPWAAGGVEFREPSKGGLGRGEGRGPWARGRRAAHHAY